MPTSFLARVGAARKTLAAVAILFVSAIAPHRVGAQPDPGPYLQDVSGPRVHAIVGARVVPEPGHVLERANVVIRDGLIAAVGPDVAIPRDARIWEGAGWTVYAGLIDPYLRVSRLTKEEKKSAPPHQGQTTEPLTTGEGHPHPRVHPEHRVTEGLDLTDESIGDLRKLGFTAAYLVPDDGIFRGRGAVLALRSGRAAELALAPAQGQCLGYDTGEGAEDYPRSLMGVVALQRQTILDAQHHRLATRIYAARPTGLERPEGNVAFEALASVIDGSEAIIVEADDVLATLRAGKLATEFGLRAVLRASGEEYIYADEVRALGLPLILPIAFPDAPFIEDDLAALDVPLTSLRKWNRAPSNPQVLATAGLTFALTTDRLRKPSFLPRMVRAALARGLAPDAVLGGFTVEAARIHGLGDRLGTIAPGKIANLTITDGDLFALGTTVRQVWVDGEPFPILEDEGQRQDARGLWRLEVAGAPDAASPPGTGPGTMSGDAAFLHGSWLRVGGAGDSLAATWSPAGTRVPSGATEGSVAVTSDSVYASNDTLLVLFPPRTVGAAGAPGPGRLLLSDPFFSPRLGVADVGDARVAIRAERRAGPEPGPEERSKEPAPPAIVPAAFEEGPIEEPAEVFVRNATIWTCGPSGVLASADLLVRNGKVVDVGPELTVGAKAKVVEAEGLHVTPGLMDCHSHSTIVGDVNEWTLSSSAMVRIGDVIDSRSPNIYRHLAGGLTLSNQLHGSANVIGGQNAVVKMRWGAAPDAVLLEGAPPGIKFALGENVTQKSWGDLYATRYPKSRMGVEQWLQDRFLTAEDYVAEWKAYGALSSSARARTLPPRRDLELEALAEILRGERFIHCHSYRQDEILMLIRFAESFGFRVRTFQHVLDGYKVANEMAAHGAMGSTFSDWWGYKPEVWDAIPYNAALMHERGVNVTMNSDSAELARRMNLEGTKAIKWGGVSPEDALAMVTLNTAIQLGVDDRLGSLEAGKDADFVLWSGSPHSTGSICLQTWVDGKLYFDRDIDLIRRELIAEERRALLALARAVPAVSNDAAQGPPPATSYERSQAHPYACGHDHGDAALEAHSRCLTGHGEGAAR